PRARGAPVHGRARGRIQDRRRLDGRWLRTTDGGPWHRDRDDRHGGGRPDRVRVVPDQPAADQAPLGAVRVGLVTHYMPPHPGGIERVAETLFAGYARAGLEVRWVSSRSPVTEPHLEDRRVRVACCNVLESILGVPVPLWGRQAWREMAALTKWADALH